jgi:Major Facilitator Superfamily
VGIKKSIVLGSLPYAFYCSTFILSSHDAADPGESFWYSRGFLLFVLYLSTSLLGLGAAMIWVAEGEYISRCANDYNKGMFMSTFRAIYMSSNIVGYLFSAFVIGIISSMQMFFTILTVLSLFATVVFLFLMTPTPQPISVNSLQTNAPDEQQSVAETIKLYFSPRMMALQGLFLSSGFNISMSTLFIPLMASHMEGLDLTPAKKD